MALRMPWFVPVALAGATAAVLAGGFALAMTGRYGERLGPAPAAPREPARVRADVRVVALGDSLTAGTGDGRGGYAARVVETLRRGQRQVALANLAVPGAESEDVLERLSRAESRRLVADADLIFVSVGGNDLTHSLRAMRGGEREPEEALGVARANLRRVIDRLRELNARAAIRVLGLYNPFEIAAGHEAEARAQLLAWNSAIDEATHAHADVLVVPIADLFAGRPDRLAGDAFHPGPKGHELIAARVLSTLPDRD